MKVDVLREDAENLKYDDNSFDFIFAISVISYTLDSKRMIEEIYRMLKEGGEAYFTAYNSISWLNFLYKVFNKKSIRENAPSFNQYTVREFESLLSLFSTVEITTDRFPFKTNRDNKISTVLYNNFFVPAFNLIPDQFLHSHGHHIVAKVTK